MATRLLTVSACRPACHHRLRPARHTTALHVQRCLSPHLSYLTHAFSTAVPTSSPSSSTPSSSDANSSTSTAPTDDSALAATARLVSPTSPSPAPSPDATVIYTSPFTTAVRRMKLFSLSSCALSLLSTPLLLLLASPSIPLSGRVAMCMAVGGFGLGTTLALTKFTEPYAIRVVLSNGAGSGSGGGSGGGSGSGSGQLVFETLNVWARPRYRSVPVEGLRPLHNRLLSNVRALHSPPAETPYSDYFLHADIVDHPLLKPLVEHSLPLPETPLEETQPAETAETISAEQAPTPVQQPAASTPPKQH